MTNASRGTSPTVREGSQRASNEPSLTVGLVPRSCKSSNTHSDMSFLINCLSFMINQTMLETVPGLFSRNDED